MTAKRYAIIENGTVTNVVLAEPEYALEQGWVVTTKAGPGWSYTGGKFAPPLEPPAPRLTASAAQCRLALFEAGLLDSVEAAIAAHPYRPVQIWFQTANEWQSDNPYVQAMALDLGLKDDTVREMFRAASLKV